MTDFDKALVIILKHECAPACRAGNRAACFVNDPDDPGGATQCGIIQRTYDAYRDSKGLPHQTVANMSDPERAQIYERRFWEKASCGKMNWPLNLVHFDTAVNHGTESKDAKGNPKISCGRLLQMAAKVHNVDGDVGPNTLAVLATWRIEELCYRYLLERFFRYDDLADQNPRLLKFQTGAWEERLKDLYQIIE